MNEFADFSEGANPDFQRNLDEWRDRMISMAINTNYEIIKENGIDPHHLKTLKVDDLIDLNKTLEMMVHHFEEVEEYEKCALLNKELQKINRILEVMQDI